MLHFFYLIIRWIRHVFEFAIQYYIFVILKQNLPKLANNLTIYVTYTMSNNMHLNSSFNITYLPY